MQQKLSIETKEGRAAIAKEVQRLKSILNYQLNGPRVIAANTPQCIAELTMFKATDWQFILSLVDALFLQVVSAKKLVSTARKEGFEAGQEFPDATYEEYSAQVEVTPT